MFCATGSQAKEHTTKEKFSATASHGDKSDRKATTANCNNTHMFKNMTICFHIIVYNVLAKYAQALSAVKDLEMFGDMRDANNKMNVKDAYTK